MRLDLDLATPWMNAAGAVGFAPPERWPWPEAAGAWVTNPLSLSPRSPAESRAAQAFPGGALLHSGLPNPGLKAVLKRYAARWQRSPLPAWAHVIGRSADEIHQMMLRLEGIEGVSAIELGVGNELTGQEALTWAEAALGELPLVIHLPMRRVSEAWLGELARLGASAITLSAPRGVLPGPDGKPCGGRVYGPSLLPLMMDAVQESQRWRLPVIAGAGVYRFEDGKALLAAGAWAVQIDTLLWL